MRKLLQLLMRPAPAKCHWCRGTGLVMVEAGWDIEPRWCGRCNGTGQVAATSQPQQEKDA